MRWKQLKSFRTRAVQPGRKLDSLIQRFQRPRVTSARHPVPSLMSSSIEPISRRLDAKRAPGRAGGQSHPTLHVHGRPDTYKVPHRCPLTLCQKRPETGMNSAGAVSTKRTDCLVAGNALVMAWTWAQSGVTQRDRLAERTGGRRRSGHERPALAVGPSEQPQSRRAAAAADRALQGRTVPTEAGAAAATCCNSARPPAHRREDGKLRGAVQPPLSGRCCAPYGLQACQVSGNLMPSQSQRSGPRRVECRL